MCWLVFSDRVAFRNHFSTACKPASKGKKQKWLVLFEAFTPLVDRDEELEGHGRPGESAHESGHAAESAVDGTGSSATFEPYETMSFASCMSEAVTVTRGTLANDMIWAYRRGAATPKSHESAFTASGEFRDRVLQDGLPPSRVDALSGAGMQLHMDQYTAVNVAQASDRVGEQVGHMDSQSIDVDPAAMHRELQEQSSSSSSGGGSTTSNVRHVPNSPPVPFNNESFATFSPLVAPAPPVMLETPGRRPPTSLPDSGYASTTRKGSFTALEMNDLTNQVAVDTHRSSLLLNKRRPSVLEPAQPLQDPYGYYGNNDMPMIESVDVQNDASTADKLVFADFIHSEPQSQAHSHH
jgi:hypothetical protein